MPKNYKYLPAITGIFVTCLLISNIIAVKLGAFGSFFLPVAVIIFPISYIFGDVLTEVYGYARARQVIWIGFACNLLAVLAIWLGGIITPAPFWNANIYGSPAEAQKAYDAILGFTPRLLTASFIAYLVGEFLNSFVIAKLKIATSGKHLWLRTITSTLVGQLADPNLYSRGVHRRSAQRCTHSTHRHTMVFKSLYEAAATPITYIVVNFLKRAENEDYYDRETNLIQ